MSDIYRIVPIEGGFKATWGFDPAKGNSGPVHGWITDVLEPYTEVHATADALAVATKPDEPA